jgi:diacylglycerol O-acyltransferase/trehalose O-mycolyltransferase
VTGLRPLAGGLLVAASLHLGTPAAFGTPGSGVALRKAVQLSPRLSELRVFSPALGRETSVRVLTPQGFDATRDHLPVLWLLHGGFGTFRDWTDVGHAEALTAGLALVVVMPDGGTGGWYADWRTPTAEGPQRWETYHLDELRPFIEARYQTRTDRSGRAIAGLSMGGFGAIHDAARHPDLFSFAASFSGAVDILHPGVSAVVSASPLAHQGVPGDIFGDRFVNETTWRANNPVDLASNLRSVQTQLRTGNGLPGGPHGGGPDIQEIGVSQATATLHHRLEELGIAHLYDDYGPGAHTWAYWIDDLGATLPAIVAATAQRRPDPTTVDHVAFEPVFSVWGYDVSLARPALETTVLSVRPDGFSLRGSGRGTVTTPVRYAPGQSVHASISSNGRTTTNVALVADGRGRVAVPVDLGPANTLDQYALGVALPRGQVAVDVTLESQTAAATSPAIAAAADSPDATPRSLPATGGSPPLAMAAALVVALLGAQRLRRGAQAAGRRD